MKFRLRRYCPRLSLGQKLLAVPNEETSKKVLLRDSEMIPEEILHLGS